tara:strand:- start:411 stop:617 length:207 start_codon:yes stop_codon:yes gene_type:complete
MAQLALRECLGRTEQMAQTAQTVRMEQLVFRAFREFRAILALTGLMVQMATWAILDHEDFLVLMDKAE